MSDGLHLRALPPSLRVPCESRGVGSGNRKTKQWAFKSNKAGEYHPGFAFSPTHAWASFMCGNLQLRISALLRTGWLSRQAVPLGLPAYVASAPHLDKRKPSKILLSATQKKPGVNPALAKWVRIGSKKGKLPQTACR